MYFNNDSARRQTGLSSRSLSLPANPVTADHSDGARVQQPCRLPPFFLGEEGTRAGTDRGGGEQTEGVTRLFPGEVPHLSACMCVCLQR